VNEINFVAFSFLEDLEFFRYFLEKLIVVSLASRLYLVKKTLTKNYDSTRFFIGFT
jgi:hypothetical protein